MVAENRGFNPSVIAEYREKMAHAKIDYVFCDTAENTDEYANFYFIGMYEGREVLYDAALYTLKLHHTSEIYEIAEHRAAQHFPEFRRIKYEEDENGDLEALDDLEEEIGLFMAEVITELEDEGEVKVQEYIELDANLDFGVGLDVALNVDEINHQTISKFIKEYNDDSLKLDDTLYTFHTQDEELMD
ncbi:MAG: hypothetical protein AAFN93_15125 [Bacteroidota bacterium]